MLKYTYDLSVPFRKLPQSFIVKLENYDNVLEKKNDNYDVRLCIHSLESYDIIFHFGEERNTDVRYIFSKTTFTLALKDKPVLRLARIE